MKPGERSRVFAAVDRAVVERIDAVKARLPVTDETRYGGPTQSDAVRLLLARGLAWVEANGTEAIPEARTVTRRTTARRVSR